MTPVMLSKEEANNRTKTAIAVNYQKKGEATTEWLQTEVNKIIKEKCDNGFFSVTIKVPSEVEAYLAADFLDYWRYEVEIQEEIEEEEKYLFISWRNDD